MASHRSEPGPLAASCSFAVSEGSDLCRAARPAAKQSGSGFSGTAEAGSQHFICNSEKICACNQLATFSIIKAINDDDSIMLLLQAVAAPGAETAAATAAPATQADVKPQAQPAAQQQAPPPAAPQQTAQAPSSPAAPQRPARRKVPAQAQPSPSKASPPSTTEPPATQAPPSSGEVIQKAVETVSVPVTRHQLPHDWWTRVRTEQIIFPSASIYLFISVMWKVSHSCSNISPIK